MNLLSLLALLRSLPSLLAAGWRLAKVFWSAVVVALMALTAASQGNYSEAVAILAGALGLGQVLHQANKTTVAAELAQLAAGAAKAQIEALKRVFETIGETVRRPVISVLPADVTAELANGPLGAYQPAPRGPMGPSGPRGEDFRGDGQAATSSARRSV